MTSSKPTILIDMDGTLFQWGRRLNEILLDLDPSFPIIKEGNRRDFNHLAGYSHDPAVLAAAMDDPRLYQGMAPELGAIEAVKEMESEGYNLFICSTPTWTNPGCVQGKLDDIVTHLGEHWLSQTILTHDKTVVAGDVLIDDKPAITGAIRPSWTHLVKDQSYNRDVVTEHRLTDWSQWRDHIDPLLAKVA